MPPTALAAIVHQSALVTLADLKEADRENRQASIAESTKRAYAADLRRFCAWAEQHGFRGFPATAETVGLYLAALQAKGRKPATIKRALASICATHRAAGLPVPGDSVRVKAAMKGINNRAARLAEETGEPIRDQAAALSVADVVAMVTALPDTVRGLRDRAIVLLGVTGAFRRSEIARLHVRNVAFTEEGIRVHVMRSKTDQRGDGRVVGIVTQPNPRACPVRALTAYQEAADVAEGFLFRSITNALTVSERRISDVGVSRAVKRAAKAAGIEKQVGRISAHSLRASAATIAISKGKRADAVQRLGGWRSAVSMAPYIREGELFGDDNATVGLLG